MMIFYLLVFSFLNFGNAELPCEGVSVSECGYDGVMMELAFDCENDCKELCDKTEGCEFFKWREGSPLQSCKLYNITFSEHIKTCNRMAGPGDFNATCDLLNENNMSCSVFRKGECMVHMNTHDMRSGYNVVVERIPDLPMFQQPEKNCSSNMCNGDIQCRHWEYTFGNRMCKRWLARGYYKEELTEVCKAYYAPQGKDKCECDDKLSCFVDPSEAIVVAGGTNSVLDEIYFSDSIELFKPSTDDSNEQSCYLPPLPSGRTEPTIDIVNGDLVVCGGDGGEHSCLKFDETGKWMDFSEISTPKTGHDSWVLEEQDLYLNGGIYSSETEIVKEEWLQTSGQDTSHAERSCAINMNGEEIIITGGRNNGNWSSVIRKQGESTEEWPSLMVGRSYHACGYVHLEDNSTVLVVAGGYDKEYKVLDSIEVLKIGNEETMVWSTLQTKLFRPLNGLKMENVNNKLFLIGGKDDQNEANTEIEILNPSANFASSLIQELPWESRWNHGMTKVLASKFQKYCLN